MVCLFYPDKGEDFDITDCEKIFAVRKQPRAAIDHYSLETVTTVYSAGLKDICKVCALKAAQEIPFAELCNICRIDNCCLLLKNDVCYLLDTSDANNLVSTPIVEKNKPQIERVCLLEYLDCKQVGIVPDELKKGKLEYTFVETCFNFPGQ